MSAPLMITLTLLREWGACWTDDAILAALAGRVSVTPREIAESEAVSLDDRLWVLCHTLWHLDEAAARTFAIDSAALVSHLAGRPDDQAEHARLIAYLRRIYALPSGDERERELRTWDAARDAAWAAIRTAAWDVARDAAWAAIRTAARDAARAAASAAAWAAAWAADCASAYDAELREAIQRALTTIEQVDSGRAAK